MVIEQMLDSTILCIYSLLSATVSVAELHHPHSANVLLQLDAEIPAQIEGVGALKGGNEGSRNYVHLFKPLRPLHSTSQRVE